MTSDLFMISQKPLFLLVVPTYLYMVFPYFFILFTPDDVHVSV